MLFLSICLLSKSQNSWEILDLFLPGNSPTSLNECYGFDRINDSIFVVLNGFTSTNLQVALVNVNTGMVNIIDTNANNTVSHRFVFIKNKLFAFGPYIRVFDFATNHWDSIGNHYMFTNYEHAKNDAIKISSDTLLLFGRKIEKFNVNTYALRTVCDSLFILGGCATNKNYYGFYYWEGTSYDSISLMVSTDKGEHWNLRRRLKGNYDNGHSFRYFFLNSDTGYISYINNHFIPNTPRQCHVLRTRDGGFTWPDTLKYFQQAFGGIGSVSEIYFLDKNVGFVSYGSSIFKTIDGGTIWYETQGVYSDGLKTIFINDSVGFMSLGRYFPSNRPYILKTTNQGGPPYRAIERTGIEKSEAELLKVNLYPNPNQGQFVVETPNLEITGIRVYDTNSKLIFTEDYSDQAHSKEIHLPKAAAGVYYVHVKTAAIPTIMTKMLIN